MRARKLMLPRIPTAAESSSRKLELTAWFAVQAPAAWPEPTVARLAATIVTAVKSPTFREKGEAQSTYERFVSLAERAAVTRQDRDCLGGVITPAGSKAY